MIIYRLFTCGFVIQFSIKMADVDGYICLMQGLNKKKNKVFIIVDLPAFHVIPRQFVNQPAHCSRWYHFKQVGCEALVVTFETFSFADGHECVPDTIIMESQLVTTHGQHLESPS